MTWAVHRDNQDIYELIAAGMDKLSTEDIHTLERKWLGLGTHTDTLVITMPTDMAPYMSISAEGEPIGLFVDIWRKWAEKTRREVVFLADTPQIAMQHLENKKADIHAAFADNSVNANLFPHAHHLYSYESNIFYPMDGDEQHVTEATLSTATLGVLKSDPVYGTMRRRYPAMELVTFDNRQQMIEASLAHKIDGFVEGSETFNVHLIQSNQKVRFAKLENVRFESKLYTLVRKDNQALISQIKEGFSLISTEELREIEEAWISEEDARYFSKFRSKVVLTEAEKRWLLRHPVIRLGALKDWAPMEFVDDNGQLIGVTADLMEMIESRAEITIEVQLFDEWSQMLDALKEKSIDMVASMEKTLVRERFANFTDGYWPQHWALVMPGGTNEVHSVGALKGKRLAVVKGYQLIPYIHEHFPNVLLQIVPDARSGFEAIRQGKADAYIDGMVAAASELKDGDYRDLSFSLVDDIDPAVERIGVRSDWPVLVGILNKVLMTITPEEKKSILENWFEIKIESGIDKQKALQIGLVVLVIFTFVLVWNRRLHAEINLRKAIENKMKHMATHDELTQLPNRALLKDRLNTAIPGHARHSEQLALLFIDLDGFKDVNDNYGHDVGDELLIQLSARFRNSVRKTDTIARFGGDEFVVLLTSLHNREEAAHISEKMLSIVKKPFALSRATVTIGASIGVAMYPDDGTTDTELMKVADTLMYEVKASGKNRYLFNTSSAKQPAPQAV